MSGINIRNLPMIYLAKTKFMRKKIIILSHKERFHLSNISISKCPKRKAITERVWPYLVFFFENKLALKEE